VFREVSIFPVSSIQHQLHGTPSISSVNEVMREISFLMRIGNSAPSAFSLFHDELVLCPPRRTSGHVRRVAQPDTFRAKFRLEKRRLPQYGLAMKFIATLERDEDGMWVSECPAIPGCVSQGATREEALANLQEAIEACLEVRAERGMPLTIETRQVEVAL
jgi:predicted RNase H-like HicB family nuclease